MKLLLAKTLYNIGNWFMDYVPLIGYWIGEKLKYGKLTDPYWINKYS